jgi:hypothetical protein
MPVAALARMRVLLGLFRHRYTHEPSVPNPALRNHVIGKMAHMRFIAMQDRDLHAASMIEMHMHGRMRQVMVIVEKAGKTPRKFPRTVVIDIDQGGHAVPGVARFFHGLAHARTGKIAHRLRSVLITARRYHAIKLRHQIVIHGNGQTLHRTASMIFELKNHTAVILARRQVVLVSGVHRTAKWPRTKTGVGNGKAPRGQ